MMACRSTNRGSILRAAAVLLILAGFAALLAGAVSAAPRQQAVVDICNRTQEVQDAILARTGGTCSTVTDVQLAGINGAADPLHISGYSNATLLSSDFAGLTGVTVLYISSSPTLRTVPANAFDELTKTGVTEIRFYQTGVRTLTAGVFSGFTGLKTLYLRENELVTLDVNVFAELSALTILGLMYNGLETLPAGAFNGLTDLERLYLHGNRLTALDADLFDPLDDSLTEIDLRQNSLTTLPEDVFDGLTGLERLTLNHNDLTTLKTDLFDPLDDSLTILYLHNNSLTTLPEDIFDGLTGLEWLVMSYNDLTTLETDVFDPLDESLTHLYLHRNSLTTLHQNIFDGLTGLERLTLGDNALSTLETDVFDPLDDSLTILYLHRNSLTTLHQDIFDGLTGLERLYLHGNSLTTLTTAVFDPLDDSLTILYLHRNSLTTLHQDIFDGLTGLERLDLHGNSLTTLHQNIFTGLTGLERLDLHGNSLTTLHQNIFTGLAALGDLRLSGNGLTSLETDLFDPLDDSLERLHLHNNSLSTLPAAIFDGLSGLQYLDLSCNSLTAAGMPLDRFDPVASSLLFLDLDSNSFTIANPLDAAGLRAKLTALQTLYHEGTQTSCLSPDNTAMSGLTVNAGALTPAFEEPGLPTTHGGYSVVVAHDVTSIEVNPVAKAANASVEWRTNIGTIGTDTESGRRFDLRPGKENRLYWDIVAEDKVTKTDYRVQVFRAFDTPGVIVSKSSLTINEGSNGTYTVRLNTQPTGDVTVTPGSNNADVTVSPSTLTFTTSNWNTAQTVTVSAARDADGEDDTATVTHTVSGYGTVTTAASVTVTVDDDDEAALPVISITAGTSPIREFSNAQFTLSRTGSTAAMLDVTVTVTETGEMLPASEEGDKTVTFAINSATATLTADVANDRVYEADSTVTAAVKTGVAGYAVHATNGSADVTVNDNDPPEMTVTLTVPDTTVEEDVGTFNVTVTATTTRDEPFGAGHGFSVTLSTRPGTAVAIHDFTALSRVVAFAQGDFTRAGSPPVWSAEKTFAVTVVDDADEESAETFSLRLEASPGLSSAVTLVADEHEVTIAKSDAAAPELLADPHGVVVDSATLTLTYNEDLDGAADSTPPTTAYTLGGTTATVTAVSVSGRTVTLTLSAAPAPTDTATLTYTVPPEVAGTSGPVRDLIGEKAAAISSKTVAPADTTAPKPTITLVASTSANRDFKLLISFGEAVTRFEKSAIVLNDAWLIEEPQISPMLINPVPDEDPDTPGNYSVPIFPSPNVAGLTVPLNVTIAAAVVQDKATPTPNDSLAGELALEAVYTGPATFISQVNPAVASGGIKIKVYFLDNYISGRPVTGFDAADIMVHNGSVTSFTKVPPRYRHDDGAHQAGDDFQGAFTGHLLFEATITPDAGCGTPTPPCTVTVDVARGAATSATFTQAYWDHLHHPGPGLPDADSVDPGHTPRPNFKANTLTVQRESMGTTLYVRALALYRDPNNFAYRASFLMDEKNQTLRKTHFEADNATLELIGADEPRQLWEFWARVAADGNVVLKVDRDLDGDHDADDYTYTIAAAQKTLPAPEPRAARSADGNTAKSRRVEAAQAVEIPDDALRAILEALRGKQAGDALTAADLATVVSLNLRDSGVADLGGLQHAVNLTDLYLEDFSLDLAPLQGLGLFVHVPGEEPLRLPSSDATLSGLAVSGVNIGAFDPATSDYTASVGNDVTETTVTANATDGGATYAVKLDDAADADGTVALAVGANAISIVVTAEDGDTTQTYTVAVTRAEAPPSSDATLSSLELSGITFDFDPATYNYDLSVGNEVTETTITVETNDEGASYEFALMVSDGYENGTMTLAEGYNLIYLSVTAEDGETVASYTITVTRAASSSAGATLSALTLSSVNIGTFDPATSDYTASVSNDVTETSVTATANEGGASYVIKLDGVADADGTVALAVGANVITVEVTAGDGQTTNIYTVTVNRAGTPLTAEFQEAPQSHNGTGPFTFRIAFSEPISTSYVVVRDHALEVTGGTVAAAGRVDGRNDLWWVRVQPDSDADVTIALPAIRACDTQGAVCTADEKVLSNRPEMTISGPTPVNSPASGAPAISGTARVGQTLTADTSGIADADGLSNASFSYQWIANDGSADTDITGATAASYLLAAADQGKTVKVRVSFTDDGGNDESLTSAATEAVAPPPSTEATLSSLVLSGVTFTFASDTEDYEASVAHDVTETTVTATANDGGATYVVKLDGVADAYGTVELAVGDNAISVVVTAEDGQTTKTYTVTVTRAEAPPPASTDATLSGLALSGVDIGTFDPVTTDYTADVGHDVTETTVTATTNDGGAAYAVKLDGVADADGTVALAVGNNAIAIEVTAEDGQTTRTYTVTVTRAEAPPPASTDATLSGLTLSGVNFGAFDSATTEYTASVGNDVTETTVTATANDGGATYVVKLDGVADADGNVPLAVGNNAIAIEVTAEDGQTTRTYTVTVTRAEAPPSDDATLSGLTLSGVNFGTFNSATTDYTASVGNDVTETTVTATANDGGATYVIKLDATEDADGTVDLAVGDNTVSVVVTAEDGNTVKTYTVTVTRAAPTAPSASVTVTLSPRAEQHSTGTDITIEWTDSDACGGQYFVGVYDNEELAVVVRVLGFHPAPATTKLSADLGLPWDSISSYDWWVGVTCTSEWTSVGKASLQSGLPSGSENG